MSIELHIGLAPGRFGFYDEKTRVNLSGANPHKRLSLPDGTDLQGLARGLFTSFPAIQLYEGEFPEAEKEKFLDGYKLKLGVVDRTARIVNTAPAIQGAPVAPVAPESIEGQNLGEATLLNVDEVEDAPAEEAPAEQAAPEMKKTRTRTTK